MAFARRPGGPPAAGERRGPPALWPAWRAVPSGWTPRFGPAPRGRCVHRVTRGRG
ncbi:MbtH family NRPS accessory protein [Streptomyces sp. M92]|uniref:MbtH family NRPS accessory protein n=1 Tax=Streptomyces sp. M92 TaxID=2944250 RepID=UPI003FA7196F